MELTLVYNLLQLLVLVYNNCRQRGNMEGWTKKTYFEIVANHHLEHQEQLSIRDEPIPVHIIHLERDCSPI